MNKRILSLLLSLFLLIAIAVPVMADNEEPAAQELRITSLEDFLTFAENCRLDSITQNLTVCLGCDLDLSSAEFEGIPIFCGTFLGNGHTITGISITADGSFQGLFRYLTVDATVQDLNIEGDIHPKGSCSTVGAVAGSNAGTIQNCTFTGTVSGSDYVGGVAGKNAVTGVI